jgi:hypothetical protein
MIQLTDQQISDLEKPEVTPPRMVNPHTNETYILLPIREYQRLKDHEYDDSQWTREELEAAAWAVGEQTGWDEYNDVSNNS